MTPFCQSPSIHLLLLGEGFSFCLQPRDLCLHRSCIANSPPRPFLSAVPCSSNPTWKWRKSAIFPSPPAPCAGFYFSVQGFILILPPASSICNTTRPSSTTSLFSPPVQCKPMFCFILFFTKMVISWIQDTLSICTATARFSASFSPLGLWEFHFRFHTPKSEYWFHPVILDALFVRPTGCISKVQPTAKHFSPPPLRRPYFRPLDYPEWSPCFSPASHPSRFPIGHPDWSFRNINGILSHLCSKNSIVSPFLFEQWFPIRGDPPSPKDICNVWRCFWLSLLEGGATGI